MDLAATTEADLLIPWLLQIFYWPRQKKEQVSDIWYMMCELKDMLYLKSIVMFLMLQQGGS